MTSTSTPVHSLTPAPSNNFMVTKKNGTEVAFDEKKLHASMSAALRAADIEQGPIVGQLVDEVMKKIADELSYREAIDTLDIREAVEIALLERGLTKAAQRYHDYETTDDQIDSTTADVIENRGYIEPLSSQHTPEALTLEQQQQKRKTAPPPAELLHTNTAVHQPTDPAPITDVLQARQQAYKTATSPSESSQQYSMQTKKPTPASTKDMVSQSPQRAIHSQDRASTVHSFEYGVWKGYIVVCFSLGTNTPEEIFVHSLTAQQPRHVLPLIMQLLSLALSQGASPAVLKDIITTQQLSLPLDGGSTEVAQELQLVEHLLHWIVDVFSQ